MIARAPEAAPMLLPYQRRFIDDASPVVVGVKARQIGWSFGCAAGNVSDRMSGERATNLWHTSVDENQGREYMEYVRRFAGEVYGVVLEQVTGEEVFAGDRVKVMSVEFPRVACRATGRVVRPRITAMTSSAASLRGKKGDLEIDEIAHHRDPWGLWKAAVPLTMRGGRVRVWSTHNGEKSILRELEMMGLRRAHPETFGEPRPGDAAVSLHRVTIHDAIAEGLVEQINASEGTAHTRASFVAELRSKCLDQETWREEFCCQPASDDTVFFPTAALRPCLSEKAPAPDDTWAACAATVRRRLAETGATAIVAGYDVARRRDLSVLRVRGVAYNRLVLLGSLVLRGARFAEQQYALAGLMGERWGVGLPGGFSGLVRLCIDETGLGMQLAEWARERFGPAVEPVTFTAARKSAMVTLVKRHVEDRTLEIEDHPATVDAYQGIRKIVSAETGAVRFDAERSAAGHCDEFWADALAVAAADDRGTPVETFDLTPEQEAALLV